MADNDIPYVSPLDTNIKFYLRCKDGGSTLRIPIHGLCDSNGNLISPATESTLASLLTQINTVNTSVGGVLTNTQLRASPIPVVSTPGYASKLTPDNSYVIIPPYNPNDTSGTGGSNPTIIKILDTDPTRKYLSIDNNGNSDVELWFAQIPLSSNINQSPKRGKVIVNNGGNRIWDVKVPTTAIYAISSTGQTVLNIDVG